MPEEQKTHRPPVIVVLGHVDHGKTSLLDFIRKSKVAEKETGGITQHIGAYQIVHSEKPMTFLDTPGHEAFSEMRKRGARVADIAVLVVAADEGIKPQTLEAIEHIKKAEIPFVVALNKIDKPNADPNRVKKELSEKDVLVEEWGGKIPAVEVSARTGKGVPELLDMLALLWELEGKAGETARPAKGIVIESHLDARRGPLATFLVQEGALKVGSIVRCGSAVGKIKALEDFLGNTLPVASPSTPAVVLGLDAVPTLGDECAEEPDEDTARKNAAGYQAPAREGMHMKVFSGTENLPPDRVLSIILKTDVKGSEEAIAESLSRYAFPEVGLRIVSSDVGDIGESDVKAAESSKAIVVGFRVKFPPSIVSYAEQRKVKVLAFALIYELLAGVRKELANLLPAEVIKNPVGSVKLLAIFKREKDGIIIGGKVLKGEVRRGATCDIVRGDNIVSEGKIRELKTGKDAAERVTTGQECGMLYVGKGVEPAVGDIVEVFEKEERRKEL